MSEVDRMTVIARWSGAKCERIHDKLRAAVGGQSDDPEHLLDVLIAAWEEMHREATTTRGAVKALEAADRLAVAVEHWDSHVTLEGLTGQYRAARSNAIGEQS